MSRLGLGMTLNSKSLFLGPGTTRVGGQLMSHPDSWLKGRILVAVEIFRGGGGELS